MRRDAVKFRHVLMLRGSTPLQLLRYTELVNERANGGVALLVKTIRRCVETDLAQKTIKSPSE